MELEVKMWRIEILDPNWGWSTEQDGFKNKSDAIWNMKRDVLPFWPHKNVRLVEYDDKPKKANLKNPQWIKCKAVKITKKGILVKK